MKRMALDLELRETIAAAIPHHSFISEAAWGDCNEVQRGRRLKLADVILGALSGPRCAVCNDEPLSATDGPNGEILPRVCGACTEPPSCLATPESEESDG